MLSSELSAGCVDVGSELAPDGCADAFFLERETECLDLIGRGRHQTGLPDGVNGDEIDVDGKFLTARWLAAKGGVEHSREVDGIGRG